jgi:hypothetical protein
MRTLKQMVLEGERRGNKSKGIKKVFYKSGVIILTPIVFLKDLGKIKKPLLDNPQQLKKMRYRKILKI